jgi:phospholipid transport system transporter-binding protein
MADAPVIERNIGRVRLRGAITLETVQALLDQTPALFDGTELRVDWSNVRDADSSAVALMLAWMREAALRGTSITFEYCSQNLRTLIGLYDVGDLIACS